jgi:hypothetical protein
MEKCTLFAYIYGFFKSFKNKHKSSYTSTKIKEADFLPWLALQVFFYSERLFSF